MTRVGRKKVTFWGQNIGILVLNTKIPIFWPQNVTIYHPTLVMNCKKSLLFLAFHIVPYILCCLKVIFWWFGKIYCGEMLIKYQNTYILMILAPNVTIYRPTLVIKCKKLLFFTSSIVSYILYCLKVIIWWFGRFYLGEMLIKYQNTYILTILTPKCALLPPYPSHKL